ncbi:hypothetical protein I316_05306 [Kwoniella heveanensis BCC8398]|uniref:Methyltransferase domain-containing protein n=1 Tax=Kwoniella heveanensis BCC8398 TaxID=1296120 RepID=A0A1B9GPQ1_9TREE|nr:hypothetical protein I316_05306 [Kwoniella heveanensis BCC8398]
MPSMTYEYGSDEPPEASGSRYGYAPYPNASDDDEIESRHSALGVNELADGEYFVEAERTYNNTTWVYRLPADQEEVIRQDRQHYIMLAALPGLYRGPVEDILSDRSRHRRLLDIGCGTGIWTQEMAELFPHVDCIGIDLMPLQHDHQMRNCTFMRVFAPTGLKIFGDNSFDVIHLRQMLHAVCRKASASPLTPLIRSSTGMETNAHASPTGSNRSLWVSPLQTNEYPAVLREAHRMLRPGGLILIHEPQLQLHSAWEGLTHVDLTPCLAKMMDLLRGAQQFRGIDVELFSGMDSVLVDAGFQSDAIDVYYHYRQVCAEDPASEDGQNQAINIVSYLHAARLIILESGVTDEDTFDELLAGVSEEVCGRSNGRAGPLGGQGVLSPWGYWWAMKR